MRPKTEASSWALRKRCIAVFNLYLTLVQIVELVLDEVENISDVLAEVAGVLLVSWSSWKTSWSLLTGFLLSFDIATCLEVLAEVLGEVLLAVLVEVEDILVLVDGILHLRHHNMPTESLQLKLRSLRYPRSYLRLWSKWRTSLSCLLDH